MVNKKEEYCTDYIQLIINKETGFKRTTILFQTNFQLLYLCSEGDNIQQCNQSSSNLLVMLQIIV